MDQDRYTTRSGTVTPNRPDERRQRPRQRQTAPDRNKNRQQSPSGRGQTRRRTTARSMEPPRRTEPPVRPKRDTAPPKRQRRSIRRAKPLPDEIPDVVYTPPRPFHLGRFAMELVTMVAVVLALVFGVSLFFRAQVVTVSGTDKYTPWTVLEASGIQVGDSLFPLNEARISGRIISALPYVKDVRVGIRLPDTVMLQIEELPVTYAVEARDGTWWLMSAEGKLVSAISASEAENYTRIQGVQITLPVIGEQAVAAEAAQTVIGEETIVVAITGAQRLEIAESILQALEQAGFLGDMDTVDVSDASNLVLWSSEKRFQLQLGDKSRLSYKLGCARSAIEQLAAYESGVLDISLSGEDKVIFTPAA